MVGTAQFVAAWVGGNAQLVPEFLSSQGLEGLINFRAPLEGGSWEVKGDPGVVAWRAGASGGTWEVKAGNRFNHQ